MQVLGLDYEQVPVEGLAWECSKCGALVKNALTHSDYHEDYP